MGESGSRILFEKAAEILFREEKLLCHLGGVQGLAVMVMNVSQDPLQLSKGLLRGAVFGPVPFLAALGEQDIDNLADLPEDKH